MKDSVCASVTDPIRTPKALGPTIASIAAIAVALLLAWRGGLFLADMVQAVLYPFELDYGEGIVWQQADMIWDGRGFGDITRYPFIVFHYPPVYHGAVKALAGSTGADMLFAGRLISVLSTFFVTGAIAWLVIRSGAKRHAREIACGATAALLVTVCPSILSWAPLMRVDMLALAFSFAGIAAGLAAFRRPSLIHLASLCFVLAVFTKQTSIAAPAALYGMILIARPRLAFSGLASATAMGLALIIPFAIVSDGGFLRHIFLYNINRFEWTRLISVSARGLGPVLALILVALWLAGARASALWRRMPPSPRIAKLRELVDKDREARTIFILFAWLASAGMISMTAGKSGSNLNYFNELVCVMLVLLGIGLRAATVSRHRWSVAALVIAVTALSAPLPVHSGRIARLPSAERQWALVEQVRAATKPVLSDDMTILRRAGRQVPWESSIFAELASTGLWDEQPFIEMIRDRRFAFIVTNGDRGSYYFDSRYNPPVADAIEDAYPVRARFGQLVLRYPR